MKLASLSHNMNIYVWYVFINTVYYEYKHIFVMMYHVWTVCVFVYPAILKYERWIDHSSSAKIWYRGLVMKSYNIKKQIRIFGTLHSKRIADMIIMAVIVQFLYIAHFIKPYLSAFVKWISVRFYETDCICMCHILK